MSKPGVETLAELLVTYSTEVKPGDRVMIHANGFDTLDLARAIQDQVIAVGAVPVMKVEDEVSRRRFLQSAPEDTFRGLGEVLLEEMKQVQAYIAIRGTSNAYFMSDVPKQAMEWYSAHIAGPVHIKQRCKHTRWCVLRYPNDSMSQLAQMSTEAFRKFYFSVCCVDYARMAQAVQPLEALMNRTERVRVVSPTTDLSFTKKGIASVPCVGSRNIPDGECFTAPERTSVQGHIQFNVPSMHEGQLYESISLTFEDGKIVKAEAGAQTDRLNAVFAMDEGASYVGEFSLGFNPLILNPMKDTLFDEKIAGSLHMALGACYDEAPNGNSSALHWDLVQIQRPEFGGGEVWFDDVLIRKDGVFVVPALEGLNPEAMK